MSLAVRGVLGWFSLLALMFANGAARVVVLEPRLGEGRARQVASLAGVALVFLVSGLLVRLTPHATLGQLRGMGLAWLGGTLAFEFLFGHFVSGLSWRALLGDYDILRGRLWPLVALSVCLAPFLCGAVAGRSRQGSPGPSRPRGPAEAPL